MAVPSGTLTLTAVHGYVPTLWVNGTTGSDSNTRAQVLAGAGSVQWATIGRAAWGSANRAAPDTDEAAAAGDVVSIAAGTYSTSINIDDDATAIVYNPANSGTSGNPITFLADGVVTLAAPNANNGIIGAYERDYITWYADRSQGHEWSFRCYGLSSGSAASDEVGVYYPNQSWGATGVFGSTGCTMDGVVIDGGQAVVGTGDNWSGIGIRNATGTTVKNCTITSFMGGTNCTGITLYGAPDTVMEHNEISECNQGIYLKGQTGYLYQDNVVIRYNYLHDCTQAIRCSYEQAWGGEGRFYQNLIADCDTGIKWLIACPHDDWFYNNTFYNLLAPNGEGMTNGGSGGTGGRAWNNIVHTSPYCITHSATMPADTVFDCEHNVYYNYSTFYNGSDGDKTLAQFKTAYADQEQASPASVNQDPLFTNAAGGDFTLQVGSPAHDLGRHPDTGATIDAGCYLTGTEVIGVEV